MKYLLLAALAACTSHPTVTGTTCSTAADCNLFNVAGTCEPTGFCSYPDVSCPGGKRYSPGAGSNLGDTCVGGDAACGAKDQACCGASACGPNLVCSSEGGTCQCGGTGQPCCDGTTCGSGLACGAAKTCNPPKAFTQVAVGKASVCALAIDKTVWCWGSDWSWNVEVPGHGAPVFSTVPTQVAGLTNVAEIHAGELHACARKSDNTVWCWGHGEHGELGNGQLKSSASAVQVPNLGAVTHFSAGILDTCAIGSYNGAPGVWCWGRGGKGGLGGGPNKVLNPNMGRLGNNNNVDSALPVAVDLSAAAAAGQTVKSLSVGGFHSCMIMSDNTVWCWGRGGSGELGNGATADTKVPVKVDLTGITIPGGVTVDEVSCSNGKKNASTCMRLSDGTVYCWGDASQGQLGDGSTTNRSKPSTAVESGFIPSKLVELASAMRGRCARAADGTVWCWGLNKRGFLGTGVGSNPAKTPVQALISNATQIHADHHTACAIDGTNHLYCWGNNQRGQITMRYPTSAVELQVLAPQQVVIP